MKKEMLENIILLAEDKKLNGQKFDKICDKGITLITKTNDMYYEGNKVRSAFFASETFIVALRGVFQEVRDIKRREKVASKVFSIPSKYVTGDLTTFISSDEKCPVYVNDFQYDASVSLDRVAQLRMIWGDANLRKLHDFQWLKSLKVVMGDVYTSDAVNLDGMNNLEVVTGDLHFENLNEIPKCEKLSYVGGNIYSKDGVFSLEEIKTKACQNVKK